MRLRTLVLAILLVPVASAAGPMTEKEFQVMYTGILKSVVTPFGDGARFQARGTHLNQVHQALRDSLSEIDALATIETMATLRQGDPKMTVDAALETALRKRFNPESLPSAK